MKKIIYFAIFVLGVNLMIGAAQEGKNIEPVQTWSGKEIDNKVLKVPPKNGLSMGLISNETDWIKLWQAWRTGETPKIDFTKNLIVYCTTQTPNTCRVDLRLSQSGNLNILPRSTLIGSKAKTFNYQIVLVNRAGIKSIKGKSIAPSKPQ